MNLFEAGAGLAVLIVTASYYFQIRRLIEAKDSEGVSARAYALVALGVLLMLFYTISIGNLILIINNLVGFSCLTTIVILSLHYRVKNTGKIKWRRK